MNNVSFSMRMADSSFHYSVYKRSQTTLQRYTTLRYSLPADRVRRAPTLASFKA